MMSNTKSPVTHSIYRAKLQKKILFSQKQIRENIEITDSKIMHRTQAKNHKSPHETFTEEKAAREYIERFSFACFFNPPDNAVIHSKSELTKDTRYADNKSPDGSIRYGLWHEASYARYRAL